MFIFYFLGVGRPRRSIFRQFWLCEEAQCVYLRRHLGSLPVASLMCPDRGLEPTTQARALTRNSLAAFCFVG